MKFLMILSAILLLAGCAVKSDRARNEAYQASLPACSTHDNEIDCQWRDVPAR